MDNQEVGIIEEIAAVAHRKMSNCMDDYAERIWDVIKDDVVEDVLLCTDNCEDGFTDIDVALSIGRAIAERLGIEV